LVRWGETCTPSVGFSSNVLTFTKVDMTPDPLGLVREK
jgi:hypothetical protein